MTLEDGDGGEKYSTFRVRFEYETYLFKDKFDDEWRITVLV